ncbi:MAG: MBL fold metallo-hydrolase [Shimia sp.]
MTDRHALARQLSYPFPEAPAGGEAVEVADGIFWLRLPLPMALDHVNIYALDDGDGWTVVDTGMAWAKGEAALDAALSGPLKGKPITRIWLTHHHPDHVGMAGRLMAQGAELSTTRTAYLTARMLMLDVQEAHTAKSVTFYTRSGMAPKVLAKRLTERPFNFADICDPLPLGYRRIREGDVLHAAGRDWTVRIGHGHAPEHATFWADDVVLAGDQILPSISPNIGLYPTEPEADPVGEWLESCERLRAVGGDPLILGGHKLPFRGLDKRLEQLVENHHGVLDRLHTALRTPSTAGETFLPIFKREISGGEYGLALVEAYAHCHHLYLQGRATRNLRDDGAYVFTAV